MRTARESPGNAAAEVPQLPSNAGSRSQGVREGCVLEYVTERRTKRARFRISYQTRVLGGKAHGADAYWSTPKARTARETSRNAAGRVPHLP